MNQNIDPDLNYCPHCNDEYRAEISTCAACGIDLLSGEQMLALHADRNRPQTTSRSLEIHPEESVLTVRKGPVLQIKELQAYLLRSGIPSLALKENGGRLWLSRRRAAPPGAGERLACGDDCAGAGIPAQHEACRTTTPVLPARCTMLKRPRRPAQPAAAGFPPV